MILKDNIHYLASVGLGSASVFMLNDILQTIFLALSILGLIVNIKQKTCKKS